MMNRRATLVTVALVTCGVLVETALLAQNTTTTSTPSRTQWDGVYTDEQAKRGESLFTPQCASCHGADLAGGQKAPALAGADFDADWNGIALGEISERIRVTMPPENAGSLTRRQAVDLLAFLLSKWRAPAGAMELPTQADQLNTIKYTAEKPAR